MSQRKPVLPGKRSIFWKLVAALALFCLLLIGLYAQLNTLIINATSRLSPKVKTVLTHYAEQAEVAWERDGSAGADAFLQRLREQEQVWAVMVDEHQHSLSSEPLSNEELTRLNFIRALDWSVGRPGGSPTVYIPFSRHEARLVMELPLRLNPRQYLQGWQGLLQFLPLLLSFVLGIVLYRVLIAPLTLLQRQANRLSEGNLAARVGEPLTRRRDELGSLANAFDRMAGRLESMVVFQRQLLRDMSHELRTPLSRLKVVGEQGDIQLLRQRLEHEVAVMERLISNTLELVWLDTEQPSLPLEAVDITRLWDTLRGDASFESGWPLVRMPCDLPAGCTVLGNLNGLAQAMENVLRNAIRHSPATGVVRLTGKAEGDGWVFCIEDQGPGVADEELERIFMPFTRLNAARPGGEGFGLGLAIARSMLRLQGGDLWGENGQPGLKIKFRLQNVYFVN